MRACFSFCVVFCCSCAHDVVVKSNVPEAQVRVDGVELGMAGDGAEFAEQWTDRPYDIEVKAPGYAIERRHLTPSIVDGSVGAPAMLSALGGCTLTSCITPFAVLDLVSKPADFDEWFRNERGALDTNEIYAFSSAYALLLGLYGCTGISVVAAAGSQRLPDEVYIQLDPLSGEGAGDEAVPPPPVVDDP